MLAFGSVSYFYVIRRLWRRFLMRKADQEQSMACQINLLAVALEIRNILFGVFDSSFEGHSVEISC